MTGEGNLSEKHIEEVLGSEWFIKKGNIIETRSKDVCCMYKNVMTSGNETGDVYRAKEKLVGLEKRTVQ